MHHYLYAVQQRFIEILQKCLSRKLLTLITIIIIIAIVHLFAVDKKKVLHNLGEKKLTKVRQKRGKIISYLYKSVNIFFFTTCKIYQNFKNHHAES